jgi:hypothetical protein
MAYLLERKPIYWHLTAGNWPKKLDNSKRYDREFFSGKIVLNEF